jgi:hypothetical protein
MHISKPDEHNSVTTTPTQLLLLPLVLLMKLTAVPVAYGPTCEDQERQPGRSSAISHQPLLLASTTVLLLLKLTAARL